MTIDTLRSKRFKSNLVYNFIFLFFCIYMLIICVLSSGIFSSASLTIGTWFIISVFSTFGSLIFLFTNGFDSFRSKDPFSLLVFISLLFICAIEFLFVIHDIVGMAENKNVMEIIPVYDDILFALQTIVFAVVVLLVVIQSYLTKVCVKNYSETNKHHELQN